MALLGSTVDPRLFIQDYSGFVDAAKMQAQGVMGLGQSIGQGIEKYQEAKKERQKLDASRKSAITNIESAVKMGESFGIPLGSTLQPVLDKLNDPNTTPYEAAMIGQSASDQIGNVLKLGMFQAELQSQSQRSQFAAAADRRRAELEAEKEAGEFKVLDITTPDGGAVKARLYNDGRVTDIYGNPLPGPAGRAASIESAGLDADGLGPPPTDPYEGPDLWDSTGNVIAPPIAPQVPTGAAAGIEAAIPPVGAPRPQAVAGIESALQAGAQASAPQAASPWANVPGYKPPESKEETTTMTAEEAKNAGYKVSGPGTYLVKTKNGKLTGITNIGPSSTVVTPEQQVSLNRAVELDKKQSELRDSGNEAAMSIPQLKEIYNLLQSGVETGFGAEVYLKAKRILGQDVSNEEAFQSLVGNEAMKIIALTKGAISDREMDYFKNELAPGLGKSVEGNQKIIEFQISRAQRDKKIARRISEMQRKGASPNDIQTEVENMIDAESLISSTSSGETPAGGNATIDQTMESIKKAQQTTGRILGNQ